MAQFDTQPGMPNAYPSYTNGIPNFNGNFTPQPQPQQPQVMRQMPQAAFIGRFVGSGDEILPNEVPMDGRIGVFPTSDLGAIYVKAWSGYGGITTVRYIPDPSYTPTPVHEPQGADILKRLEAVEKSLNAQRSQGKPNQQRRDNNGNT